MLKKEIDTLKPSTITVLQRERRMFSLPSISHFEVLRGISRHWNCQLFPERLFHKTVFYSKCWSTLYEIYKITSSFLCTVMIVGTFRVGEVVVREHISLLFLICSDFCSKSVF